MHRLSSTGYQTDFEVPFETYFITDATWPQENYNVRKSTPAAPFFSNRTLGTVPLAHQPGS